MLKWYKSLNHIKLKNHTRNTESTKGYIKISTMSMFSIWHNYFADENYVEKKVFFTRHEFPVALFPPFYTYMYRRIRFPNYSF